MITAASKLLAQQGAMRENRKRCRDCDLEPARYFTSNSSFRLIQFNKRSAIRDDTIVVTSDRAALRQSVSEEGYERTAENKAGRGSPEGYHDRQWQSSDH